MGRVEGHVVARAHVVQVRLAGHITVPAAFILIINKHQVMSERSGGRRSGSHGTVFVPWARRHWTWCQDEACRAVTKNSDRGYRPELPLTPGPKPPAPLARTLGRPQDASRV